MDVYWYLFLGTMLPAIYYIFIKIFTFPLITRKAHEFVIMVSPERVKIKKVTSHVAPMFLEKKSLYWFAEAAEEMGHDGTILNNRYHIYLEGINQPVTKNERMKTKLQDIANTPTIPRQIGVHNVRIPTRIISKVPKIEGEDRVPCHLARHFILTLSEDGAFVRLSVSKQRQALRVSVYHTLGINILQRVTVQQEMESAGSSGAPHTQLVQMQLTDQLIRRKVNAVQEARNFSSSFAYYIWNRCKPQASRRLIVNPLSGEADPRMVAALAVLICAGISVLAAWFLLTDPEFWLGPMPEELKG